MPLLSTAPTAANFGSQIHLRSRLRTVIPARRRSDPRPDARQDSQLPSRLPHSMVRTQTSAKSRRYRARTKFFPRCWIEPASRRSRASRPPLPMRRIFTMSFSSQGKIRRASPSVNYRNSLWRVATTLAASREKWFYAPRNRRHFGTSQPMAKLSNAEIKRLLKPYGVNASDHLRSVRTYTALFSSRTSVSLSPPSRIPFRSSAFTSAKACCRVRSAHTGSVGSPTLELALDSRPYH